MSGFLGMFGKKSEIPAPPIGIKPPAARPPGVGTPPPIADFPSSIMGLKAPKPIGNKIAKSTQRIVLPAQKTGPLGTPTIRTGPLGSKGTMEPTMRIMIPGKVQDAAVAIKEGIGSTSTTNEKIVFPMEVAFRALPPAILLEQAQSVLSPDAEFSVPLDLLTPQLSAGKIEFTVEQMMQFLPVSIFKPTEEISAFLEHKVMLPMMEVFTRISAHKNSEKLGPVAPLIKEKSKSQLLAPVINKRPLAPPPTTPLIPRPMAIEVPDDESNLENLLAAAQNALPPGEAENTTITTPISIEDSAVDLSTSNEIPPPPFVAPVAETQTPSSEANLDALLKAAQEALEGVPVGEQTFVVPELQEDKIDFQEPIPAIAEEFTKSVELDSASVTAPATSAPTIESKEVEPAAEGEVELDLNRCDESLLMKSIHCSPEMAKSIVDYRLVCGGFSKLESLLLVPGMTERVYRSITGDHATFGRLVSVNELLNIPMDLKVTEEQVIARIALWPAVRGCLVKKGTKMIGSIPGVGDIESFIANVEDCLRMSRKIASAGELVHQTVVKDAIGSLLFLQRGETLLITGFQGGMIPGSMVAVLEKLIIELHEVVES